MRRRRVPKKELLADPIFNSKVVSKFINMVMLKGKKSTAQSIVYGAFNIIKEKLNEPDVLKIFHKAVENVRPRLEVKPRRVGGATYQIPIEVRSDRGNSIAFRWIRDIAKGKKGRPMQVRLAEEIISAYNNEGGAIKKRDDMHKMAEANKAFAHFRW